MDRPSDDLDQPLWGWQAIAKEINRTRRQTFYMLENGLLPAKKIGGKWMTTRRALRQHLAVESVS